VDKWLAKEVSRGTSTQQRALLLACALRGTTSSLELLEKRAFQRGRPNADRAWSLLLYGAYHPAALQDSVTPLKRAKSEFERDCFLAGLLKHGGQAPNLRGLKELKGKKGKPHSALLNAMDALSGRGISSIEEPTSLALQLLISIFPFEKGVSREVIDASEPSALESWRVAAKHKKARTLEDLRRLPIGIGGGALALVLYESSAPERGALFQFLRGALLDPSQLAWLWGAAGDLGLSLPLPSQSSTLLDFEVGGLLLLCLSNPSLGEERVRAFQPWARRRLDAGHSFATDWPAAVLLAVTPQKEDLARLRKIAESSSGADALRALPIWHLASGRVGEGEPRRALLRSWARELGAGWVGYLDQEGPRWTAYLLLSGTQAASERLELQQHLLAFERPHDHSPEHALYEDIAEFLFSPQYFWDLP
jgi:hypothetical protein